ncbi:MAG: hypothetical protein K6U09_12590 [Acidobacteriia bacterium]|nr:hypothetical protein [Terriglobia bacterium]
MAQPKGLWIPLEILQRRDLQQYDKIVYALISFLDQYGGLQHDMLEQWAGNLGCDRAWLDYELQRLAKKYLIHRQGMAWRLGPAQSNPATLLPELPDGVQPLSVSKGIATVYDETQKAVKFYRVAGNGDPNLSHKI